MESLIEIRMNRECIAKQCDVLAHFFRLLEKEVNERFPDVDKLYLFDETIDFIFGQPPFAFVSDEIETEELRRHEMEVFELIMVSLYGKE